MARESTRRFAEEMTAKYETEKKELEIERQQNLIARHNMQRWLLAGGVTVFAVVAVMLWYALRLRTRRNHALTERNEALADLNLTKDRFFSIISHDLKNPAIAQRNALQKLVKNVQAWDMDTMMEYYEDLLKSADSQVELIYNLLGWAQVQTGRIAYKPDAFILSGVLPDILLARKIAEHKGVNLELRITQNALVTGDRNMLSTVLRNLLTNAIKFTASGGTVTLLVEPAGEGKYTVVVSDTGIGMNREQTGNLFCIDSTHSRQGTDGEQGSGLGLIVCREFLEKHGTILNVESEEGKGSRFWFEI
jgi:signal transduction histidine kinase